MNTDDHGTKPAFTRRAIIGGVAAIGGAGALGIWQTRELDESDVSADDDSKNANQPGHGSATGWSGFFGNPRLTGFTPDPGPGAVDEAEIAWTSDVRFDWIGSAPVVANEVAYVAGILDGAVHIVAIDIQDGRESWAIPILSAPDGDHGNASLTLEEETLFVVTIGGAVMAIDVREQAIRWETALPWSTRLGRPEDQDGGLAAHPHVSLPVVADGRLFVTANDYVLHALDISDGSEAWSFPLGFSAGQPCTVQPIAGDGLVSILSGTAENPDRMYILDAETGNERSRVTRDDEVDADVQDFAVGYGGDILLFGEELLTASLSGLISGTQPVAVTANARPLNASVGSLPDRQPVVADDAVYVVTEPGTIIAHIDLTDPDEDLEITVPEMLSGLVAGGDTLYFASGSTDAEFPAGLYAYDRHTGERRWHVELGPNRTRPGLAVYGDMVIVTLDTGHITAIRPGSANAHSNPNEYVRQL